MVYIQETDYNIKSKSLFFHLPCVPCCVYITPLFFFSNYTSPRSNKSSIEAQSSGQQKTSWRTGKKATAGASSSFNFYEAIICFPHFQDAVMYLLINGNVQITGKFKIVARYLIHKNFDPVELVETTWFFFFLLLLYWSYYGDQLIFLIQCPVLFYDSLMGVLLTVGNKGPLFFLPCFRSFAFTRCSCSAASIRFFE